MKLKKDPASRMLKIVYELALSSRSVYHRNEYLQKCFFCGVFKLKNKLWKFFFILYVHFRVKNSIIFFVAKAKCINKSLPLTVASKVYHQVACEISFEFQFFPKSKQFLSTIFDTFHAKICSKSLAAQIHKIIN